jgi:glutamate synthase domain-containing protein 2
MRGAVDCHRAAFQDGACLRLYQPPVARDVSDRHEPQSAAQYHGEGGEAPERFRPTLRATGAQSNQCRWRPGASRDSHYLVNAREAAIKMAQGAKPARRTAPAEKVYPWIAATRFFLTPYVQLISPPAAS